MSEWNPTGGPAVAIDTADDVTPMKRIAAACLAGSAIEGSALAQNVAGVAGGAVPPLIAGALRVTYGGWAISLMLATVALTSLVSTYLLPETNGTTLRSTRRGANDASLVS